MKISTPKSLAARLIAGGTVGLAVVIGLFAMLFHLVDVPVDYRPSLKPVRIEFTRVIDDTDARSKRQQLIEKVQRPELPQTPTVATPDDPRTPPDNRLEPIRPDFNPPGQRTPGQRPGITIAGGTDSEVQLVVGIPPEYPQRALSRAIEGWVRVQFTITATGSVRDATVVSADPVDVFDEAALSAIARWRYHPRVVDGEAVERVGVQTLIEFRLTE